MKTLKPKILSQLLLIHSFVANLTDIDSFFGFTCRGLESVPGVKSSRYAISGRGGSGTEIKEGLRVETFKLFRSNTYYGEIQLGVDDFEEFLPYKPHIQNLTVILSIILEEKRQRLENEEQIKLLNQRTREGVALIEKLQKAMSEIKTLRGILPLCSFCKRIRDDKGYWEQVDVYIHKYSEADITHSMCPECMKKNYPKEYEALYPEND